MPSALLRNTSECILLSEHSPPGCLFKKIPLAKRLKKWKKPKFKHVTGSLYKTKWNWYVTCPENLELGKNVDIGIFTYINARYGVRIGDNVQIGSHCAIFSDDTERGLQSEIIIEEGVCIGSHSVILPKYGYQHVFRNVKAGSVIF